MVFRRGRSGLMLIIHERGRIGLSVSIPLRLEDRIKRTWIGRVGRKSWRAEVGICYKIAWMRIKHEVSLSLSLIHI